MSCDAASIRADQGGNAPVGGGSGPRWPTGELHDKVGRRLHLAAGTGARKGDSTVVRGRSRGSGPLRWGNRQGGLRSAAGPRSERSRRFPAIAAEVVCGALGALICRKGTGRWLRGFQAILRTP